MATDSGKGNDADRWRLQLEEVERELESKAHQLDKAGEVVCHAITAIVRSVSDKATDLQVEISGIARSVSNGFDALALEKAVTTLTDRLVRLGTSAAVKPDSATAGKDHNQLCALLVAEILYQLLESVSLPAEMQSRLENLKQSLESGVELGNWGQMLEQVADIAADIRVKINSERLDTETFLKQVTGRLQELDTFIQGSREHREASVQNSKDLDAALQAEMRQLQTSLHQTGELKALKNVIQTRLETIEMHFTGFRNSELQRHEKESELVRALTQRLKELENEIELLRQRVQHERMQAMVDPLTGIPNRLGYVERINQEYARWKRFNNPLSLVVWDVDHFKNINDSYGHAAGDKALKSLAKLLNSKIRETDFLARYGGEEFVVIMTGANRKSAEAVADKLRQSVEESSFHFKGEPVSITISCGVAEFTKGDDIDTVFERADQALYKAKEAGRNRVEVG